MLLPIPKPGKDPASSDNYRPIALAPTLSKVFEWSILLKYRSSFITSSLQFGFNQGFSSDLCTGLVKNVIARNLFNDTNVYGCFLLSLMSKFAITNPIPHRTIPSPLEW